MWDEVFGDIPMPAYHVGDKVRIVDNPVRMVFYWNEHMDKYCGVEATIEDVYFDKYYKTEAYRISICQIWSWSWNCFVKEDQEEINEEEFIGILNL